MSFEILFGIMGAIGTALGWWSGDRQYLFFGLGCLVLVILVLAIGAVSNYLHNRKIRDKKGFARLKKEVKTAAD